MGKLIDADALQQHFMDMQHYERCACNFMDDGGEPATEWYCVEDAMENAPTIAAIPVEWLKQRALDANDPFSPYMMVMFAWYQEQKEQEAQDGD